MERIVELGIKIRSVRRERGLTQEELAKRIGVNYTYISKIEKGRLPYTPSQETLRLLAQALEVNPLELLDLAEKVPDELASVAGSQPAREFLHKVRHFDEEDWRALNEYASKRLRRKGDQE
jgi:transcriptional regulator with XRE-family HTH domain